MSRVNADAQATMTGDLTKMVVRTADGRVFNLGRPASRLYPLRLRWYKFQRRAEFKAALA